MAAFAGFTTGPMVQRQDWRRNSQRVVVAFTVVNPRPLRSKLRQPETKNTSTKSRTL